MLSVKSYELPRRNQVSLNEYEEIFINKDGSMGHMVYRNGESQKLMHDELVAKVHKEFYKIERFVEDDEVAIYRLYVINLNDNKALAHFNQLNKIVNNIYRG